MLYTYFIALTGYSTPTVQWWSTSRSTLPAVRVNAVFVNGDNYTEADQYEWSLPDGLPLSPGNSVTGFQAAEGEVC